MATTVSARCTRGESTRAASFPRVTETTATSPGRDPGVENLDQGLDRCAGVGAVGDDERGFPQHFRAAGQHHGFERGLRRCVVESIQRTGFIGQREREGRVLEHVPPRLAERDRDGSSGHGDLGRGGVCM